MSDMASVLATAIQVRRTFDGSLFDYAAQKWIKPTPESLAAANKAVVDVFNITLDLIPFPLPVYLPNAAPFNITREVADGVILKISNVVKDYVNATTVNKL